MLFSHRSHKWKLIKGQKTANAKLVHTWLTFFGSLLFSSTSLSAVLYYSILCYQKKMGLTCCDTIPPAENVQKTSNESTRVNFIKRDINWLWLIWYFTSCWRRYNSIEVSFVWPSQKWKTNFSKSKQNRFFFW